MYWAVSVVGVITKLTEEHLIIIGDFGACLADFEQDVLVMVPENSPFLSFSLGALRLFLQGRVYRHFELPPSQSFHILPTENSIQVLFCVNRSFLDSLEHPIKWVVIKSLSRLFESSSHCFLKILWVFLEFCRDLKSIRIARRIFVRLRFYSDKKRNLC